MTWTKFTFYRDNMQIMKAFWHEAFNRDFHYDDVIKMKNGYH